jgi:recombinational DNA repair protein (RecF pathway)
VYALQTTREARALVRNVIKLLRRLIQGEAPHESLFDEVKTLLCRAHAGNEDIFEEVFTLRTLHVLGYIAPIEEHASLFSGEIDTVVRTLPLDGAQKRKELIAYALRESHL